MEKNLHNDTVEGFGEEWNKFSHTSFSPEEKAHLFEKYFRHFPFSSKNISQGTGADIGCGSGRWATLVAPKIKHLHLVDASEKALRIAKNNLSSQNNTSFHHCSVDELPFEDNSLDFAYSLGVLHHVPDTKAAIVSVAKKLKPQAPFLLYLYYRFDNRPPWYALLWKCSDYIRRAIAAMPWPLRYTSSQLVALFIYWPLARTAWLLDQISKMPNSWPLAFYRNTSFYVMRTDALDRFGTKLEQRFTKKEIEEMLLQAGFEKIHFNIGDPYWTAIAWKKA